ncbi:MAG TPA: ABC transporter ATP-binding protein [Actinomycetota bacterium]|nr:ABC transporter ATP-binding protein [Actinomycetota bacterium]
MDIEISGLGKTYVPRRGERIEALRDVTASIRSGEFVTVIGPSGCGKSTMLDILAGLTTPSAGTATIGGRRVGDPSVRPGLVFQRPVLLPWRTALDNVVLPAQVGRNPSARNGGRRKVQERGQELLDLVGLGAFGGKYPWELSGGMQQRVAIARALLLEARVMCMDEPFAALDELSREQMHLEFLRIWSSQRFTVLFVTHNVFESVFLSDRVLVMTPRPGRVVADVPIDLPRPRKREMIGSDRFSKNLRRLREAMRAFWE